MIPKIGQEIQYKGKRFRTIEAPGPCSPASCSIPEKDKEGDYDCYSFWQQNNNCRTILREKVVFKLIPSLDRMIKTLEPYI